MIKKRTFKKLLKSFFVLFLVISWLLTSLPGIPFINFPPKIKEAQAAAPTFVAVSAIGASTTGDFTITLPAHQANDILLAISWVRLSTATMATPAGWTLMTGTPFVRGTVARYYLFWKRATSSAETNPLFDTSGTDDHYAMVGVYRGVITTGDPFEASAVSTSAVDPSIFTGVTTLTADALVVAAVGGEDNNNASIITTATNPVDFTEHYLTSATGSDGAVSFSEAARTLAGATGNVSVDWVTAVPVGAGGIVLALKPLPPTTTLGADAANDPGATTVAPGSGIRSAGQFIFTTSSGSDTIPDLTLTLGGSPAGSYAAVDSVSIRSGSCSGTLYYTAVAPTSDSVSFSGGTALSASTGGNTYIICITPKDHTLASGTYSVSPYISSTWTSGNGNTKAGTDSNAYALTIDNASPAGTTGAGATSGENTQSTVSWTNPGDTDFQQVYIYCKTSSMVIGEAPTEGTDPTVDGTACGATAKLKYKGTASPQIISGLTNGTPYYFRIYARDTNGNFTAYSATQEVSGTPSAAASIFTQNKYLWYVDNDLADPTAIWGTPDLIENQAIVVVPPGNDPPNTTQELRLRVNYVVKTADIPVSSKYFKLEYKAGTDGICTTGSWTDVGTGVWVYATSTVTDGADIVKVLSDTTAGKGEEYVKSKPSQVNHVAALTNEIIEYDFHIVGTSATANSQYSFRVVETNSGGTSETVFDTYTNCPTLTTEPGTANLLRHGNVFTEGLEKGFFWTD